MNLQIIPLDLQHRLPVWLQDNLWRLDLVPTITSMKQYQIYWFRLCEVRFHVVTLKGEGTKPYRSQNRSSKVSLQRALGFPLNTMWIKSKTLFPWWTDRTIFSIGWAYSFLVLRFWLVALWAFCNISYRLNDIYLDKFVFMVC